MSILYLFRLAFQLTHVLEDRMPSCAALFSLHAHPHIEKGGERGCSSATPAGDARSHQPCPQGNFAHDHFIDTIGLDGPWNSLAVFPHSMMAASVASHLDQACLRLELFEFVCCHLCTIYSADPLPYPCLHLNPEPSLSARPRV